METRTLEIFGLTDHLEVRLGEGDNPNRLVGYAAVFNSLSRDLGGFKERIAPGAFKDSVASNVDVRALVGHDAAKLLGRTANGTLRMSEDAIGLRVEIDLPEGVSYANDVRQLVKRRDIRGMSFGFNVRGADGHKFSKEGGQTVRELRAVDLKEVSVVANPAYDDTSIQVRVDPAVVAHIAAGSFPARSLAARKLILATAG